MCKEDIDVLRQLIEKVDMRTRRIETLLIGDEEFKIRGLVDKVNFHNLKVKEYEIDKVKVLTGATIISAVIGFLSTFFHKLFD